MLHCFRYCIFFVSEFHYVLLQRNDDWNTDSCYFDWEKIETKEARQEILNQYFYAVTNREGVVCEDYESLI